MSLIGHHLMMGASGGASSPTLPVTTNLWEWHDADDASTITDTGSTVIEWADKSGNARHLDQDTGSVTTGTHTIGGLNALYFNGSVDLGRTSASSQPTTPTFYAIVELTSDTPSGHIIFEIKQTTTTRLAFWLSRNLFGLADTARFSWYDGTFRNHDDDWDYAAATPLLLMGVCDSTNVIVQGDPPASTVTKNATPSGGVNSMTVGSGLGSNFMVGKLGELIIYDDDHDSSTRTQITDYLTDKWGL